MRNYKLCLGLVIWAVCWLGGLLPSANPALAADLRFYTTFEEIAYHTPPDFVAQSGLSSPHRLELLRQNMEPDFKVADLLISVTDPAYFAFIGYAARDLYLPQSPEQFAHRMTGLRSYLEQGWLDELGQLDPDLTPAAPLPEQGWLLLDLPDRMAFSLYLLDEAGPLASTACHIFCHGLVVEIHIQRQLDAEADFPAFAADSLTLLQQINLHLVE